MTDQREYRRRWRAEHLEQIRERAKENARRRALAELSSIKQLENGVAIVTNKRGGEYIVGQLKREAEE